MLKQKPDKFVLGITGSFASGKSTVAKLFAGRQAQIIDADR
ncbi:MAG: dephospho-CoA kinase, partial [Candidatus Omnitrophica bacterium]|nr:dephospho-CoA kinase [Candidatus Omnitrophota bacterium]